MKYFKFVISFFLIVILAAGFILAKPTLSVEVIYTSGRAEYLTSGETEWKEVKKDLFLYSGDSIKTHKNSYVGIAFDAKKNNVVNIEPDAYVVLKLKEAEKIELIDGEVFSSMKRLPRGSRFEIRTPTAVCGARGTDLGVNANKTRTIVSAYENDSYTKGIKKDGTLTEEVSVKEGYQRLVKRFEKPSKLMKISNRDIKRWEKWRGDLRKRVSARKDVDKKWDKKLKKIQDTAEKTGVRKDEGKTSKSVDDRISVDVKPASSADGY